jgi:Macrocin-O-methyltransferase (TylF)
MIMRLLPTRLQAFLQERLHRFILSHGYIPFDTSRHYAEDGLFTFHNDNFRADTVFRAAYTRGVRAGNGVDPHFEWRVHVALWAAATALRVPGDFVECGVNAGMMSSAIMHHLGWSGIDRKFYLVDTFAGPVFELYSGAERQAGAVETARELLAAGAYVTDIDRVRCNFSEWPNAIVIPGPIPDVLPHIAVDRIAFLHIDLNCAMPERAALEHFWTHLSTGALVLLDDYAHERHACQQEEMHGAAEALGAQILSLPTGQGLIIVP